MKNEDLFLFAGLRSETADPDCFSRIPEDLPSGCGKEIFPFPAEGKKL